MPSTLQLRAFTTTTTAATMIGTSSASATTTAAEMMPSLAHELAKELSLFCPDPARQMSTVARFHNHDLRPNQCCSAVVRRIAAPIPIVWGLVRRFDEPQTYKHFLRSCRLIDGGDGGSVGCLREVRVVSGLPAATSTERLEVLDDDNCAIGFSIVGGDHRLQNYRSATTLHRSDGGGTVVVESYVVDVPPGNTKEETCIFVDIIVRCNLQNLSQIAEKSAAAVQSSNSPATASSSSCKVS